MENNIQEELTMKRETKEIIIYIVVAVLIFSAAFIYGRITGYRRFDAPYVEYDCDVKNLRLSTTIKIAKNGEHFANVKGDIFAFITDPLTMYDAKDKQVAYAGDAYHFITQDSHTIYVNNEFAIEMVGLFKLFGETYDIYDFEQKKIARVECNVWNTEGQMYDENDTLLAEYTSNYFFNDFKVRISEKCELDERTVLMIFCSYYSDQHVDNQ